MRLAARRRTQGFTLIEMMVALAVFSLAALTLLRLEGVTIRSTEAVDATLMAQIVARNVVVDTMSDAVPPPNGQTSGIETNGGRPWTWTRTAAVVGDRGVVRIDVAVADQTGATLARLTAIRPPDPPPGPDGKPQ